jgi:hypothetical protein
MVLNSFQRLTKPVYPPMAEQELVENALQRIAGVLPDQSHRDLLKELLDQGLERSYAAFSIPLAVDVVLLLRLGQSDGPLQVGRLPSRCDRRWMMSMDLALEKTGAAGALACTIVIHFQWAGAKFDSAALPTLTPAILQPSGKVALETRRRPSAGESLDVFAVQFGSFRIAAIRNTVRIAS